VLTTLDSKSLQERRPAIPLCSSGDRRKERGEKEAIARERKRKGKE